jgi:hypothetical protein
VAAGSLGRPAKADGLLLLKHTSEPAADQELHSCGVKVAAFVGRPVPSLTIPGSQPSVPAAPCSATGSRCWQPAHMGRRIWARSV